MSTSSAWPSLYLYPLNADSFVKHINLTSNQRVKIGRQTNARTVPAENNGYFDSKVLSRQHAEVWEESGKIFIKDVKSSNGTFINGERLSPEGLESEPYELKSDDIVEFGIDIVGEDNKTIIHHKVAARVVCVFTEQDALVAARAEQHQHQHQLQQQQHHQQSQHQGGAQSPSSSNASPQSATGGLLRSNLSNGAGSGANNFAFAQQRRPNQQPQGLGGMGGMGGGSMRPPGQKSGLTFDHILSRLQGELQKSRETGAELHNLTGAMNDIHDTLGGNLPPNLPPYPQSLPPVRPPQDPAPVPPAAAPSSDSQQPQTSPALNELQSQLHDTQSSLANHVDKIRALEGVFKEHEAIKREVSALRELMEQTNSKPSPHDSHSMRRENEEFGLAGIDAELDDDDDARSITTVVPHELERVEEEDEEQLAASEREQEQDEEDQEDRRRRRAELGRPRTPEPSSLGMSMMDDERHESPPRRRSRRSPSPSPRPEAVDELTQRLTTLSNQLENALQLSTSLQAQHTAAQTTISALEEKVEALETLVRSTAQQQSHPAPTPEPTLPSAPESLTEMIADWKKSVEGQWSSVREEWATERERLASAREEWENKVKSVESSLGNANAKFDAGLASLALLQTQNRPHLGMVNGDAISKSGFRGNSSGGLVTPPSPRSLSADSNRPRQRRKRTSSSRGRGRSSSREDIISKTHGSDLDTFVTSTAVHTSRTYSPPLHDDSSDSADADTDSIRLRKDSSDSSEKGSLKYLETPESSVHRAPVGLSAATAEWANSPVSAAASGNTTEKDNAGAELGKPPYADAQIRNVSTAVGVLVLSVAAAAVIWRVKPE